MQTLQIGDHVRHTTGRKTGTIKKLNSLVATITLDEPFPMSEKSNIIIDTQICLIENLEKL